MRVAVNPQLRAPAAQQPFGVRHKGGVEGRARKSRVNAVQRGRVVRDDHRGAGKRLGQLGVQPARAGGKQSRRVLGREQGGIGGGGRAHALEVEHELARLAHGLGHLVARSVGLEVRPHRAAQKTHATQHQRAVVQQMHVRALEQSVKGGFHLGQVRAVELVVANDVEHRLAEAQRPGRGAVGPADVAGQHHHVGRSCRLGHALHAQVQVRKNVKFHDIALASPPTRTVPAIL